MQMMQFVLTHNRSTGFWEIANQVYCGGRMLTFIFCCATDGFEMDRWQEYQMQWIGIRHESIRLVVVRKDILHIVNVSVVIFAFDQGISSNFCVQTVVWESKLSYKIFQSIFISCFFYLLSCLLTYFILMQIACKRTINLSPPDYIVC